MLLCVSLCLPLHVRFRDLNSKQQLFLGFFPLSIAKKNLEEG